MAEVGCGPGGLTGHLRSLGLDAFRIDLSPAMVRPARELHPGTRFDIGSIGELALPDGALGRALAWYSIIHTPPQRLPGQLAELSRVRHDGGRLLLAFQAADAPHPVQPYDHQVAPAYRWSLTRITELLRQAGLDAAATLVGAADPDERTPHAYVLATKTGARRRNSMRPGERVQ